MKTKTRNLLIGTALAAAVGATGIATADMGGYGGTCPQGGQMQQGQGPGSMMNGMMGRMMGGMQSGMHGMSGMQGRMQGGMQGMSGMQGGMMGGTGSVLDLTAEQMTEMSKLRQQFLPQMGELRGRMQATQEQLRALMQGAADEAGIAELADQKGGLMAEMIKLQAAQRARMQALLTDEQREQIRQHRPGMGMGPGMMGTPPTDG